MLLKGLLMTSESYNLSFIGSLNGKFSNILIDTGFPGSSAGKESACNAGDPGVINSLGREDPMEKGMACCSVP